MNQPIKSNPLNRIFAGKPDLKTVHISNSALSEIKRVLMSGQPFLGDEKYLKFGSEMHSRFLLEKPLYDLGIFSEQEEVDLNNMVDSLNQNLFVRRLMDGSTREIIDFGKVEGTKFKWIGDIVNKLKRKKVGADLKTTSAKTEKEFINLALNKYDYLRQSWCYKIAGKLDEFYFIGIQKREPYNVYILNVKDYAKAETKIIKETKFLINFFKQYGRVIPNQVGTGTKSPSDS